MVNCELVTNIIHCKYVKKPVGHAHKGFFAMTWVIWVLSAKSESPWVSDFKLCELWLRII